MDWLELAKVWGPAVPVFVVFVFFMRELVNKEIPRGFARIAKAVRVNRHYLRIAEHKRKARDEAIAAKLDEILGELRGKSEKKCLPNDEKIE